MRGCKLLLLLFLLLFLGACSAAVEQEPRACLGAFPEQEILQTDRPSSALGE